MNDSQFRLTRSAFAKSISKTIGSVKQAMRRGNYRDQYVVCNGQYFFRPQEALRENQDYNPGTPTITKRKINRGNHEKAHYPNEAFRQHNELKKLISLQKKVSPEVANEYVIGFDQWKEEHNKKIQRQVQKSMSLNVKNYGGFIKNSSGYIDIQTPWRPLEPKVEDEYDRAMKEAEDDPSFWKKYY